MGNSNDHDHFWIWLVIILILGGFRCYRAEPTTVQDTPTCNSCQVGTTDVGELK